MYNQITANKRKTAFLIGIFVAIVIALGWFLGSLADAGRSGVVLALTISAGMALISYYAGGRIALGVSGARPTAKSENPYLYRIVENLCITAGIPVPKIYVISDDAINAFATGRDPRHASIAVTSGALTKLENEELEGVVAHELSHIKNFDIRIMTVAIVLVGAIALLADWLLRIHVFGGGRDRDRGIHPAFLVVGLLLAILAPLFAQLIQLAVSRRREYLADASGALLTRFPEGLARALQKIGRDKSPMRRATSATAHLYIANPFNTKRFATFLSTHPPLEDRIKALRTMA
ncbi:MAG: M48 family metallopeptidase [Patescibacteria group bacterium]